jgi:hypothetical protein
MEVRARFVPDPGEIVWIIRSKVCITAHIAKIIPLPGVEVKAASVFVQALRRPPSLSHHREPNRMRRISEPRLTRPQNSFLKRNTLENQPF